MKINFKKFVMPALALCTACLMMGVEECDPENPTKAMEELLDPSLAEAPKAVISIHEIIRYPRASEIEQKIPSYFGKDVTINRNPMLFSKEIIEIKAIPQVRDPNYFDLHLKLTVRGRKMWIGLSVNNRREQLAFVIDGMFYRSFQPRMIYDDVTGKFSFPVPMEIEVVPTQLDRIEAKIQTNEDLQAFYDDVMKEVGL